MPSEDGGDSDEEEVEEVVEELVVVVVSVEKEVEVGVFLRGRVVDEVCAETVRERAPSAEDGLGFVGEVVD